MKRLTINKSLFEFLKSTGTVCLLSTLIGLACVLADKPFLPAFILAFASQYILFTVIAGTITNYFKFQTRQKELDKLVPLSTILECAACSSQNITTFIPDQNERFEFTCLNCQSRNVVNINFVVAKVTEFTDPMMPSPTLSGPASK
jgi:hypothetical protein